MSKNDATAEVTLSTCLSTLTANGFVLVTFELALTACQAMNEFSI